MTETTCEQFRSSCAELALGIADAHQRTELLAHARHCPTCRRELALLDEVADLLVDAIPPAEPPAGFETSVLASLGAPASLPTPVTARTTWRRSRLWGVAAAVGAAVAIVAGAVTVAHGRPAPTVASAQLISDHHDVGQAMISGGDEPWMAMAVDILGHGRTVRCELRLRSGATVDLGSFGLTDGYGYWAAPVPTTSSPVTGTELTDTKGRVLATGALTVPGSRHR